MVDRVFRNWDFGKHEGEEHVDRRVGVDEGFEVFDRLRAARRVGACRGKVRGDPLVDMVWGVGDPATKVREGLDRTMGWR